jgi:hypothetical protein
MISFIAYARNRKRVHVTFVLTTKVHVSAAKFINLSKREVVRNSSLD